MVLKNACRAVFFLFLLLCAPSNIYSNNDSVIEKEVTQPKNKKCKKDKQLSYYLFIEDFIQSFIEIPTSNVSGDSSTIASSYLAGRAPIYNMKNQKVGTCSAS